MSKIDLFAGNDSDGETAVRINSDYATKYTNWRQKEELTKLQSVYGKASTLDYDSDTTEDDDDAQDLPVFEKYFYTALSCLKKKDPRVFDPKFSFTTIINDTSGKGGVAHKAKKKEKPLFLRDYERKLIVEKNGMLSDDEGENNDGNPRASSPTYVQQQRTLQESFKQALDNSDNEKDEKWGSLFQKKIKTTAEEKMEDDAFKEWLKGQKVNLKDKDTKSELKGLRDYWNDPNLNADEVYLKDYILNKRYLYQEDKNLPPKYHEMIPVDEDYLEEQEEFETKYNFRFEEPDQEFIKRYPRVMESSLRSKDDRRKIKRQEIRERKEAEMVVKTEEIKRLKALKKKEILEKIEKIKEVTGNDVYFDDDDLEGDFDPEKYDKKMQEVFSTDYYGVEGDEVPKFHEVDNYLEIENWEKWRKDESNIESQSGFNNVSGEGPECDDPNFNMDCDYDPKAQLQQELIMGSKSKKKQRRKSKLARALAREKPVFNPKKQKFEEYFDEYYKLDFEDIIGDLPCRFKYRQTTPNSYGLTVDEILRADVKELNKWCSLKKIVRYKPEHVEANEVKVYQVKASNEKLKRKLLPSLYTEPQEYSNEQESKEPSSVKVKEKQKKRKQNQPSQNSSDNGFIEGDVISKESHKKNKKRKEREQKGHGKMSRDSSYTEPSIKKRKYSVESKNPNEVSLESDNLNEQKSYLQNNEQKETKKQQFNKKTNSSKMKSSNKHKKQKNPNKTEPNIPLSDVRLKAYGVRPKKFKNKIKYGNQQWNTA